MELGSYLMGVFDGEGCITAGRNARGGWSLHVSVTMASETIVRLFQERWGGGVGKRSKITSGGLTLWSWQITGATAIPFLHYAIAHSYTKRQQAVVGLALAESTAKYRIPGARTGIKLSSRQRMISEEDLQMRTELVNQMRALNGARSRYTYA